MFKNEECFSKVFDTALTEDLSPFDLEFDCIAKEFDYREGRTDIIVTDRDGNLLAFELKLYKWKQALYQAYRNSSFAHYSYIVMPLKAARRAAMQEKEFIKRGVGLCSVKGTRIYIEICASRTEPLRPWLTESALEYISVENNAKPAAL